MLEQLSCKYSCSGNKFYCRLGVEIDRNICKNEITSCNSGMMIFYQNTALQPSSVNKPSPESIGGLYHMLALSLSLNHLDRILAGCRSSSHHSTSKKEFTYQVSSMVKLTTCPTIGEKSPKIAPLSHHLLSQLYTQN